jgi:hypothetical protein
MVSHMWKIKNVELNTEQGLLESSQSRKKARLDLISVHCLRVWKNHAEPQ